MQEDFPWNIHYIVIYDKQACFQNLNMSSFNCYL
jgi:hypothetical protein